MWGNVNCLVVPSMGRKDSAMCRTLSPSMKITRFLEFELKRNNVKNTRQTYSPRQQGFHAKWKGKNTMEKRLRVLSFAI